MMKTTIAIIGATGSIGSALASRLAESNYRLLLFDMNQEKLNSLATVINQINPKADVEFMNCMAEASWEADIIIPDIAAGREQELANKIAQFTNRKLIIWIAPGGAADLQRQLPGVRLVKISGLAKENVNDDGLRLLIETGDREAAELAATLLRTAGFMPTVATPNKNLNQSKINKMETTKWIMDPTHSEIHFKVRHLMVSWVTGSFKQFDATVETQGEDISTSKVRFTADIDSISTNNEQRDAHLRTGDFFDAQNYPKLVFESDRLEKVKDSDGENYKLYGTLTMRGNSKKVVLNVEYGGTTKDPWGNTRTGFSVSGKINRKDFGVSFSMVSETGGVLLGEDVTISANVEFVKEAAVHTKAA